MISSKSKKKKKQERQKNCAGLINPKETHPIYIKANFELNEYKTLPIEFTPICSTKGSFTNKLSPRRKELLPEHRNNSTRIKEFNQRWRERKDGKGRTYLISKAKSMDLTSRKRSEEMKTEGNEVKTFIIEDKPKLRGDGRDYFQKKINRKKQKQAHLAKSISSKPDPPPIALSKNDSQSISAFNTIHDFRDFDVKPGDLKIKKFNFTGFQNISKTEEKSPQTMRFMSKNNTQIKVKNSLENFVESRNLKNSKGDAYIDIFKTMGNTAKSLKKNNSRGRNLSLNLTQYFNKFSEKLRSIDELRKSTESKIYKTFQDSVFRGNSKENSEVRKISQVVKSKSIRESKKVLRNAPDVAHGHVAKKKLRKFTKFGSINEPLSSRNANHLQISSNSNLRKSLFNLKSQRHHTTESRVGELTKSYIKNLVSMRTAEDSRDIINKKKGKQRGKGKKRRFGSYTEFIKSFKSTYMIPKGTKPRPNTRSKLKTSGDFTLETMNSTTMRDKIASFAKKFDKKNKKKCVTTRNSRNKRFFNSSRGVEVGQNLDIKNLIPKSTKAKFSDFYIKEKDPNAIFSAKLEFKKKSKSTRKFDKEKSLNLRKLKQLKVRNRSKRLKKVIGDISSRTYVNRKLN